MTMIRGDERLIYHLNGRSSITENIEGINDLLPSIIVTFDLRFDGHEFYLHVSTTKIFTLNMLPSSVRTCLFIWEIMILDPSHLAICVHQSHQFGWRDSSKF
jgi:hypothetical protein